MDAVTTINPNTPPLGGADALRQGRDAPPQSPDRLPVSIVAQRQIGEAVVFSAVRRSPRLSCLPPPQPLECQDRSSDGESESVSDVTLRLSREETPENDVLPPDEPSTVLANRILRASDNPSPPPQDLSHPCVNYLSGKDGHFPPYGVSAPPSPFRPINLLERLNHLSDLLSEPLRSSFPPAPGDPPDIVSNIHPANASIPTESNSPYVTSVPTNIAPYEESNSAGVSHSDSTQHSIDDHLQRLSQHLCEPVGLAIDSGNKLSAQSAAGLQRQPVTMMNSLDSEIFSSSPKLDVASLLNQVGTPASDIRSEVSLPSCGRNSSGSSSFALNAVTLRPPSLIEDREALPVNEPMVISRRDNDREGSTSKADNDLSVSKELQDGKRTEGMDAELGRKLNLLSPCSTVVLSEPVEQTNSPAESTPPPATPPQAHRSSPVHPDFSHLIARRPLIASMPERTKVNLPYKSSSEVAGIFRTPAQRVPIGTFLARGTSSLQRTIDPSTRSEHSQLGHFLAMKALGFSRPKLDVPSRSPAKRIRVTDLAASPTRGDRTQTFPLRFVPRSRSEPPPHGPSLTRSRSVESCTMSKSDDHEELKESICPMVPFPPRIGTKLPFPLAPGQRTDNDLPLPILEENEIERLENTESDGPLGRVAKDTTSHLRQPSTKSRIPRIGNKPYARPPSKNGKATLTATNPLTSRGSIPASSQLAHKNNAVGISNTENTSAQPANDLCLAGSLKRKRGAEAGTSKSRPIVARQVVPGILSRKSALISVKNPSQTQVPSEPIPTKVTQPLKLRKVVDGMLSARYAPAKTKLARTERPDSPLASPSPLSELSSSNEEPSGGKPTLILHPPTPSKSERPRLSRVAEDIVVGLGVHDCSSQQDTDGYELSRRPRRTSRARKPAQQQYILDVFNNTSTRPSAARRKPQSRVESDSFMGMNATALKALTTSNTTKNQQTVAVLATEVIRKEGLRPESPTVKARTILQKQRDERDIRRRERAQRRGQMSEEDLGPSDTERVGDRLSLLGRANRDESDCSMPQKHRRGPGDEGDYETPDRPERIIESLSLEEVDRQVKPTKQVKWHRGLLTATYLDEIDPRPKPLPKSVVARGCLAPTSKNLPLDPLGNLVDIDNRPSPELTTEQIVVKRYLYDNDIEPEPIPVKMTRSKSKKSRG